LQFLESGERGVKVCLVIHFAAANQVTVNREHVDHPPLGVEVLVRNSTRGVGDDRS
jgi:hypothetical protein